MIDRDPYLWVDARGNWHLLQHAFNVNQTTHCGSSMVSAHAFSRDGKKFTTLQPHIPPYGHTVRYADGSSKVYSTLERPKLVRDSRGAILVPFLHFHLILDSLSLIVWRNGLSRHADASRARRRWSYRRRGLREPTEQPVSAGRAGAMCVRELQMAGALGHHSPRAQCGGANAIDVG